MNGFLPSYHDPIFSIILIILIAIALSMIAHAWGIYRQENLQKSLYSFLDKFDTLSCSLEEEEVPFEEGMTKPLLLLAHAFEKSGNYDKAISICLYLIRHTKDDELLIYLGSVYLRAGFYERAEEIFLEIISRHPRRKDVLKQLEYLYETLQEFTQAHEAIEALQAQGEDTKALEEYLRFLEIRYDLDKTPAKKVEALEELLIKNPQLYRPIIQELFHLDTSKAWQYINTKRLMEILDILWYLPPAQLRLDIISKNSLLKALYYARADIEEYPKELTGDFAIDMLVSACKSSYKRGDLSFSYLCTACKQDFPISFVRCPSCLELNTLKVEERLVEQSIKNSSTLF